MRGAGRGQNAEGAKVTQKAQKNTENGLGLSSGLGSGYGASAAWLHQHGEVLDPAQALAAGYLDEVVPLAEVPGRAIEVATELAERVHPGPFRLTRTNIRGALAARVTAELHQDLSEFSVGG